MQGLLEAFKILDTPEHRKSRIEMYVLYFRYLDGELEILKTSSYVQTVTANFDVIGELVRTNNIHREEFLFEFGSLAYRCWRCLEVYINEERQSREFELFMFNFEWLAKEAWDFWLEIGYDLSETKLYHPHNPARVVDFKPK